jgi:RNA polymerase sigma factor (sigma-70 family)
MEEKYEFPDDSTEEDDGGWGNESEEQRTQQVISELAAFVKLNKCLLGPTFNLDKHVAKLVCKLECPEDLEKDISICPCERAKNEIKKYGSTSCGIIVTENFLRENHFDEDLLKCKTNLKLLSLRERDKIEMNEEINQISQLSISLESPIHDDEGEDAQMRDLIEDIQPNSESDATSRQLLKEQIEEVLNTLTPREQRVLQLRFGLEDGCSRTLEEVGKEFNVTGESIRQIQVKALRKLRHPSRSRLLKENMD